MAYTNFQILSLITCSIAIKLIANVLRTTDASFIKVMLREVIMMGMLLEIRFTSAKIIMRGTTDSCILSAA